MIYYGKAIHRIVSPLFRLIQRFQTHSYTLREIFNPFLDRFKNTSLFVRYSLVSTLFLADIVPNPIRCYKRLSYPESGDEIILTFLVQTHPQEGLSIRNLGLYVTYCSWSSFSIIDTIISNESKYIGYFIQPQRHHVN